MLELRLEVLNTTFLNLADKHAAFANGDAERPHWTCAYSIMNTYADALHDLFGRDRAKQWLRRECDWRGEVAGFCIQWAQAYCYLDQMAMQYGEECQMTPVSVTQLESLLADVSKTLAASLVGFDLPPEAIAFIREWEGQDGESEDEDEGKEWEDDDDDEDEEWEEGDDDEESVAGVDTDGDEDGSAEFYRNWLNGKTILEC
ncbi:hypothetical protein VHEMI08351 [[Torrubiella] hemipterigena]|uniref:Uncharacterized protein n=1 Tax=[Torrubiella] hemipterigena TaxID=1531966 RepID=A0A0A1TPL3_9HYPO|nr:hypothetical protein VHEMI08351 [[Torrubiella] hemipterigena]